MDIKYIINKYVTTDWIDILNDIDCEKINIYLTEQKIICKDMLNFYPPDNLIFNSFNQFNKNKLKVVLLGQDTYHRKNQAMGLCFSVPPNIKIPPSLLNIYKEINSDIGIDMSNRNGDLSHWATQGILMLNSSLTVLDGLPNYHQKIWTPFTDNIIKKISDDYENIIFILWGKHAQNKIKFIDTQKHHIIKGAHPSPLSAHKGFFGCRHFSECNKKLIELNKEPIKW